MVCRSKHSDIQIEVPRIWYTWHHGIRVHPMSRSEFWEDKEKCWWSCVNRGVGYVFVIGEFVKGAVASLERVANEVRRRVMG